MKRQFYRRRLLALSTAVLLGLSSLFPSIAGATEITAEEPAVTDTVDPAASTDTSNPASADTVETADGETTEETTEPERLEPDAYFEPIQSNDTADWPQGPAVWAESAVVMDLDSGAFLYSKNMDDTKYPASITKILTTLIAIEHSRPSEKVTFSANAVYGIEQGSSNIGIRLGENLTMEDCLYGMMLESANEVCVAVAEHISGSVDAFVELMNQKAASLGCTNTHFTNPNGLPDENHYTTAHDMALIAQAAYNNATFRKVCQTTTYCIGTTNKCGEKRWLSNHHKMLPDRDYTYEGCTGGKTGFTQAALNTLVTYAERDGRRLVCVSLRTNGRQIYTDTASLLDYGFNNFQNYSIFNRKTWADAKMLYPSLYFGQPETVANLRPSCTVTLPAGIDTSALETTCNPGDGTLCRTYTYNQYPVGYESIPDTAIQTLLHSPPTNTCKKSGSAAASDLGNSAKETASGIFQKILAFFAPVGTVITSFVTSVFTAVPWYYFALGGALFLIIIMEIVLAMKKKKKRKKKKTAKKKNVK